MTHLTKKLISDYLRLHVSVLPTPSFLLGYDRLSDYAINQTILMQNGIDADEQVVHAVLLQAESRLIRMTGGFDD